MRRDKEEMLTMSQIDVIKEMHRKEGGIEKNGIELSAGGETSNKKMFCLFKLIDILSFPYYLFGLWIQGLEEFLLPKIEVGLKFFTN